MLDVIDVIYDTARSMLSFIYLYAGAKQKPLEKDAGSRTIEWLEKIRNSNGSLPTSKIRLNMQRVMQNNAAVFRTQETLEEGIQHAESQTASSKTSITGQKTLLIGSIAPSYTNPQY